jgi:hypothetical protein
VALCAIAVAAPVHGAPEGGFKCDLFLDAPDAKAVLGKITPYIDYSTSPPKLKLVRKEAGGTACTWQGAKGQLLLRTYDWHDVDDRRRFARQLCDFPGSSPELCGHARDVRDEKDARVAVGAFARALRDEAQSAGNMVRPPGTRYARVFLFRNFIARPGKLGTLGWGPVDSDYVFDVTCLSFENPGDQDEQARCAKLALQLGDAD